MKPAMKLYYAPGACSLAVHIALREVGATFELVKVDLATHTTEHGANFFDMAPRGYVPLLELADASRHSEGAALLQYVADLDATQALIGPPGSPRRLAVVQWLTFISTELHKGFSPWLWHKETAESTRQAVRARLATRFAELEAVLARSEFLAGDYSVADAYGFTILNWANLLGLPLTAYPQVQAWMARVAARAAVQAALRAEGLQP